MNRTGLLSILTLLAALLLLACDRDPATTATSAGEADHHGPEEKSGTIDITAAEIEAADIEVLAATPARLGDVLQLYGTVQPNAERTRQVSARFAGVIQTVNVAAGDSVVAGQTLATIESNESLRSYQLIAPLSGVITERHANPGEAAGEAPLFTVADLATVWIELALFPRDQSRVHMGQQVQVRSVDGALQGAGKVIYIAPISQRGSQTLIARVLLDNRHGQWAPGLYVSAAVVVSEREVPVAVSNTALQRIRDDVVVFVRSDAGFIVRTVTVGGSDENWTEIRSGLAAQEKYAAKNSFVLKSDLGAAEAEHAH